MPPTLVLCELSKSTLAGIETYSPFCLKVHRALRHARLSYTSRHENNPAAYGALNPRKQVPVLLVDGSPVFDSSEILRAIEQLAPASMIPFADARLNAEAWLWEEYADRCLNGFLVAARWIDERNWTSVRDVYFEGAPWVVKHVVAPQLRRGVRDRLKARDVLLGSEAECWALFERTLDDLDARAPASGFWMGDRLSAADVSLFAQLRSLMTPLTAWQSTRIEARPRLAAYVARVDRATSGEVAGTVGGHPGGEGTVVVAA